MALVPGSTTGGVFRQSRGPETVTDEALDRGAGGAFRAIRDREIAAQAQARSAATIDPNAAARARQIGRFTGEPPELLVNKLPEHDARAKAERLGAAAQKGPVMQWWLADPLRAAASSDDLDVLERANAQYEKMQRGNWFQRTFPGMFMDGADWEAVQQRQISEGYAKAAAKRRASAAAADGVLGRAGAMFSQGLASLESGLFTVGAATNEALADVRMPWQSDAAFAASRARTLGTVQELRDRARATTDKDPVRGSTSWEDVKAKRSVGALGSFVLEQGVASLPMMAGAAINPVVVATSMSGTIGQERATNNGQEDADIANVLNAAPYAVASALLDRFGLSKIVRPVGSTFARKAFGAAAVEGVTEFAQSVIEYAGGTVGTAKPFDLATGIDQGIAGAVAGFGMGGTLYTVGSGARRTVETGVRMVQARAGERLLSKMMADAEASELRKRDPSLFAEFLQAQAQGTAAENIFVPAEKLRELYQSNGWDWNDPSDDHFGQFTPDFAEQMQAGLASGGDVVIPVGAAAARLAGSPEWEAIKDDARVAAGSFSPREASLMEDEWATAIEELGARAEKALQEDLAAATPRQAVFDSVFSQSREAGFSINASRAYADLWAERYQTRSERLGDGRDAMQLFSDSVGGIRSSLPGSIETYRKGDGLDLLINAMRNSAEPMLPEGQSLLDKIIEGGGVEDPGGDIKSMGGDRVSKGGVFGRELKTLIRQRPEGEDALSDMTGNALTLDDWALRLWEDGYFPDYADRPSVNDLLEAINEGIVGRHVFPAGSISLAAENNNAIVSAADDLRNMLFAAGVDPATATRAEIEAAIAAYEADGGDRGFEQALPETIDIEGVARSTVNSDGRPLAKNEAGVRAFWKWFGDSKAVDDQGRPLVVYHGTPANFDAFDKEKINARFDDSIGFHFSDRQSEAEYYGLGGIVLATYQKIENPLVVETANEAWRYADNNRFEIIREIVQSRRAADADNPAKRQAEDAALLAALMDDNPFAEAEFAPSGYTQAKYAPLKAYDGIIIRGSDGLNTITFDPTQIKSINNRGTFDPADARILFQGQDQGGARGRIDFLANNKANITLFEGRDLSTLLHEGGHLWLEELRTDALATVARSREPVTVNIRAVDIFPFAVHSAAGEIDQAREQENEALRASIAAEGVKSPLLLDVDRKRGQARLANGNHRAVMAADIDPDMMIPVQIRYYESDKRPLSSARAYAGEFDAAINAASPKGSGKVFGDWETVKAWFKREGIEVSDDGDIPTEAHELWARGMERYFMEGTAPSRSLEGAFSSFRAWLLRIYQVVTRLNSNIDKDVRAVMDRLIATDNAIAWAVHEADEKALFDTPEAAGMTPYEFNAYRGLVEQSRTEAFDKLLFKTMERIRRARTVAYQEERKRLRLELTDEIKNRPEFRALDLIRGNGEDYLPLDRRSVIESVGRDALGALPRGRPGKPVIVDGGASADVVAERSGFADGRTMLEALLGVEARHRELVARKDGRTVLDEAIDAATEAAMIERHGDTFDDGSIEEEALELIHSDAGAQRLATEVRQLARKVDAVARGEEIPAPLEAVNAWAQRVIRDAKISQQASGAAVERHRRAEQKAARAAERAYLDGDFETAFREKQKQMFANALYRAARDAKNNVDVIARRLDRLARSRGLKGMDPEYLDRIHELLERYDLKRRSAADVRERESFDKWAKRQEEAGIEVFIPERLTLAGNVNFTKMKYADLVALDDAVQSLAHLGREKMQLKLGKEARDFDTLVQEAQGVAMGLPMRPWSSERNEKPSLLRGLDSLLTKIEFLADQLDGGDPNGVFNRVLVQEATRAANEKEALVRKVMDPLAKLYIDAPKEQQKRWGQRVSVPEFVSIDPETKSVVPTVFLRSELIAVALNIGNQSNLEKMLIGETMALPEMQRPAHGWTEQKVMAVLNRELQADDWAFVQAVWDNINQLWPDIVRSEREITGVTPEKIEAREVVTPFGTLAGGYYPLVYDPNRSQIAADNSQDDAVKLLGQIGRAVSTPKGHTMTRTSAALPITFSLERVLFNHVGRVATRIAYGRYVRDALKFIGDPRIRKIVDQHAGLEYHKQLKPWLQRQVNEAALDTNTLAALDRVLRQFRINAQMVWMGFRVTTMISQIAGWNNSAALIGPKYLLRGMSEMARNMGSIRSWVFDQSPEMAGRAQAFDRDVRAFYEGARKSGRREGKHWIDRVAQADHALGLDKVRAAAFWGIGMIDVFIVSMPTWIGAYYKGTDEGLSVDEARAYADKAVRESQSAGRAKDLSAVQGAGEAVRVLTLAYSYFSVLYNQQRATIHAARAGDYRRAAMNVFWIMMMGPVASALLTGDWPEEEEEGEGRDVEAWAAWAARKMFFGLWGGVPIVRDIAAKWEREISGKFSGDIQAPIYLAFSEIERPIMNAVKLANGEEPSTRWLRDTITPAGYFLGLPTGQVGNTAQYLYSLAEGEQNPEGAADVVKGIVKGPQKEQE